ncbi:zinc finger and BTB domain-containing protein 43-like [Macrosteles quadrilineatus]|uniref:zinc finger and BTB domain-containing protein 43-like n=1 Tax=Macrosteles quadrilineatus TaxID=74068 RepID=UPI0023E301FC|nr:zinc finger and BTB domain-containing protein 43-like [Macrosteles quadrilineatus]XP_054262728.1 zinc finger and BTB domain-containing protein 43-like [Macrosteles quadrilineatus]
MANENNPQAQHFNLRWNNHSNNILQVFAEQLNCENLVDVTISCQGKFLKAHKMVLSACSPYFQELFKIHQVQHPVIIMNGMSYSDIKLVIEFMYRGEIKVQEADLGGLLLAAETLQVKGLSNVRNKYEKGQIQKNDALEHLCQSDTKKHSTRKSTDEEGTTRQTSAEKDSEAHSQTSTSSSQPEFDDDLPATIKVEPPDIRDIDEEPEAAVAGWDSPRLIIDMKESKETMTEGNQTDVVERKRPNILRQAVSSIRIAAAQGEHPNENKVITKKEDQGTSTSAKCYLWPKRSPSILGGKWGRPKICKIPRPPNAFMIFANDWRRKLALEYPVESNKEISVRLGSMWKNLDADSKETYYSAARKADEEHKVKYPGYYYSPKEARIKKGLKRKAIAAGTSTPVDALRFVKVYMTSAEKANLEAKSVSLFRELLPKPDDQEMETLEQDTSTETDVNGIMSVEDGKQVPDMDSEALLEVV